MKKLLLTIFFTLTTQGAIAEPVSWELVNFQFNDGGKAFGSFSFDSDTQQFSDINIFTTSGSLLNGRHFISTAGDWGNSPQFGVLAFSDVDGPDFTGAGWFRIDAYINFNAPPGYVANQWLDVGAESFCVNYSCWVAANEITNPGYSRDTISGYLVSTSPIPEPTLLALNTVGLIILAVGVAFPRRKVLQYLAT